MGFQRNVPSMRPLLPRSRPEDKAQWHPLLHVPWWHWCTQLSLAHQPPSRSPATSPWPCGQLHRDTSICRHARAWFSWSLWPRLDRGQQKFCEHDPKKKWTAAISGRMRRTWFYDDTRCAMRGKFIWEMSGKSEITGLDQHDDRGTRQHSSIPGNVSSLLCVFITNQKRL